MNMRDFWKQALAANLFPLSIEAGTKRPIGLWEANTTPTPEPLPQAGAVGLRCLPQDGISALDVDCSCPASSGYLATVKRELNAVPIRYGRKPRFLVPFKCDGPIAGHSFELPCKCRVQIIRGQFVAHGTHPDTKQLYEWENFEAPWPVLSEIAVFALLSYLGVNATASAKEYMSEIDVIDAGPKNDSERDSIRQFVTWRLEQLTRELSVLTEGRGVPIFNAAASIMPAIHWEIATVEEIGQAVERAGHRLDEKRGGRSLGEEIIRATDAGVLVGNPTIRRLQDHRTFTAQAFGTGLTAGAKTLGEINGKKFSPMVFAVEDMLPEGFVIFAAKPKVGKTAITWEIALSIVEGGKFWGKQCRKGGAIAYAFEDNERRCQARYRALRPDGIKEHDNFLIFDENAEVPRVAAVPGTPCFTQHLERELAKHPNTRLVIIDPIVAVRADQKDKTQSLYRVDYDNIKAIQRVASKYRVTIIGVHHANKKQDVQDAADSVSGSTGLTGAADGVWSLEVDKERENGKLWTHMRDTESVEVPVAKKRVKGGIKWEPVESETHIVHSDIERRIVAALISTGCEANFADLMLRCPGVNENTMRVYLHRMSNDKGKDLIAKSERGLYKPKGSTPKSRPEGARDMLVSSATEGGYDAFQAGRTVNMAHVLPRLHNSDRAPVTDGLAVSMDGARAILSAFADVDKLIRDMESRKLAYVFDKILLIPYTATHGKVMAWPWTLQGMMQQKARMPWE